MQISVCLKARGNILCVYISWDVAQNVSYVLNQIACNAVVIIISAITAAAPKMKSQSNLIPY